MTFRWLVLGWLLGLGLHGCKPDLEIFAPEKEQYLVLGILHADEPTQWVRIGRVFQIEADGQKYLDETSTTVGGLEVWMEGGAKIWTASQVDTVFPGQAPKVLYRFDTQDSNALSPGTHYTLHITRPGTPALSFQASTTLPEEPFLHYPSAPYFNSTDQVYSFPVWEFTQDPTLIFQKGNALGYEVRVYTSVTVNGAEETWRWGPSPIFFGDNGCTPGTHEGCFSISGTSVTNFLASQTRAANGSVRYDYLPLNSPYLDSLPHNCRVEITAVDTALTRYLYGTSPFGFGVNLLMDKPDFTNVSGGNIGIFGSIHPSSRWVILGACSQWKAGFLTGFPPQGCN